MTRLRWVFTVSSLRTRRRATSVLLSPLAIRPRTSVSRAVSWLSVSA